MKIKHLFFVAILVVLGYFFITKWNQNSVQPEENNQTIETPESTQTQIEGFNADGSFKQSTDTYSVSARVPLEQEGINTVKLTDYVNQEINRFIGGVKVDTQTASTPWNLNFDYVLHESDTILSYIVQGYEYTGGAHENGFVKSFNYSKTTGKEISVLDIVNSPDDLHTFSALADKELTIEYPEGVSGDNPQNWSVWYTDNTSVTFIFQPYQIAAYALGQQEFTMVAVGDNTPIFNQKYFSN